MSAGLLFDALVTELEPQGIAVAFDTGNPADSYPAEAVVTLSYPPAGDTITQARGQQLDSGAPLLHDVAESLLLRIDGSSTKPGAEYRDHHDAVKLLRARVLVAVRNWARSTQSDCEVTRAGWVDSKSPGPSPQGATYAMTLRIADQVLDEAPPLVTDLPWLTAHKLSVAGVEKDFPPAPGQHPVP